MGPSADLYAAGAMLYEILTEVPPEGRWSLPTELREDLPPEVDAVVERALHHHPKRRFAGAEEMAAALLDLDRAEGPDETDAGDGDGV